MAQEPSEDDDQCPVCGHMYTTISESAPPDVDEGDASVCEGDEAFYVHEPSRD